MPRRNLLLTIVAFGMAALFACALVRLLLLRYERGDIYPAYSTLRADPLGTKAFYEALDATGHYQVSRGYVSLHRELEGKPDTLFYLGLDADEISTFTKDEIAALNDFVGNGGRVIITLSPEDPKSSTSDEFNSTHKDSDSPASSNDKEEKSDEKNPPEKTQKAPPDGPQSEQEQYERERLRRAPRDDDDSKKDQEAPEYHRSLAALWGFGLKLHSDDEDKKKDDATTTSTGTSTTSSDDDKERPEVFAQRETFLSLEPTVPWKSALYFVRLDSSWIELYQAKSKPVFIWRKLGKGEILIATDSYFISNEALRNDRRPLLLNQFVGAPGHLLFDESHLGTEQQEGVMALAEKFRLEGFLYGMLGVLALVLWRNSTSLVPPRAAEETALLGGAISGKDSRSGLVNLLRRNIPSSEILKVCLNEWKRGVTPSRKDLRDRVPQMESIVTSTKPDRIVQSYHDLRQINVPHKAKETYAKS